jgi:hypothetical protein
MRVFVCLCVCVCVCMCVCHLGGLFGLFKKLIHNRGVGQGADVTELRLSMVKEKKKKKGKNTIQNS